MYYTSKSFGNQAACLFFSVWGELRDENIYNISFAIGKNRKQVLKWGLEENSFLRVGKTSVDKTTGKNGMAPLIWAYNSLSEFEKYIREITPVHKKLTLRVQGSNSKRHHVYERYLSKIGYEVVNESLIKYL